MTGVQGRRTSSAPRAPRSRQPIWSRSTRGSPRSRPSSTRPWPTPRWSATSRSASHRRTSRRRSPVPRPCATTAASESTLGDLVADSLRRRAEGAGPRRRRDRRRQPGRPAGRAALRAPARRRASPTPRPTRCCRSSTTCGPRPLTGAQFKTLLEQQWQTNPDGTVPAAPYLQLGLSDNVDVHLRRRPRRRGSRITSITVNGAPLDPAKSYRIGTFSFLATGGDNFRVFKEGTARKDSGLVDRDAWIDVPAGPQPGLAGLRPPLRGGREHDGGRGQGRRTPSRWRFRSWTSPRWAAR